MTACTEWDELQGVVIDFSAGPMQNTRYWYVSPPIATTNGKSQVEIER